MTIESQSQSNLKYRIATTAKDLEILRQFRIECGWGLEKIVKYFGDPDRPFCIFSIPIPDSPNEGGDGDDHFDVGMGGWILNLPEDLEASNRLENKVNLSSLFIRPQYRKYGLGTKAMDLLESLAVDKYHAKIITLDTTAFHSSPRSWPSPSPSPSSAVDQVNGDVDGGEGKQGKVWFYEDFTKEGMSVAWYKSRGYVKYRENKPTFPHPTPDDPHRLLTAMFLQKIIQ